MNVIFASSNHPSSCMGNTEKKQFDFTLIIIFLSIIHRCNLNSVILCLQKHTPPQRTSASLCKLRRSRMWHAPVVLKISVRWKPERRHHFPETSDLHITIRYMYIGCKNIFGRLHWNKKKSLLKLNIAACIS